MAVSRETLTRKELADLRDRLAKMSVTGLRDFYFAAYYRCRSDDAYFPSARSIQELVQAWKEMRKFRKS